MIFSAEMDNGKFKLGYKFEYLRTHFETKNIFKSLCLKFIAWEIKFTKSNPLIYS